MTGRKSQPTQCLLMELPTTYKLPWEVIFADNSTSGFRRYTDPSPYQSNPLNSWRGYLSPTVGHSFPWTYTADRQVVQVNWLNVSQGVYVCANGGNCTAPDVCECAPGWIGFDCRTPVCEQGFYHPNQQHFVSGQETSDEVSIFGVFMDPAGFRLQWPYSNPSYSISFESYLDVSTVQRVSTFFPGVQYDGPAHWLTGHRVSSKQGGYRCSIRAVTQWENISHLLSHPNFYSRYMDSKVEQDGIVYSWWQRMMWPPTHQKSRILDQVFEGFKFKRVNGQSEYFRDNLTYVFTNEGFRRWGVWNTTMNPWEYGLCILEFKRSCPDDPSKELDLESKKVGVLVQDTDISFRSRLVFNDHAVLNSLSRWRALGGECVNQAVRGCFNNGTCVAPNTCKCAAGWTGYSCNQPVCSQVCHHHGNCTGPNQCTCERGWRGDNCTEPICAQECQNGGTCVAPDTCKCAQWSNAFVDGRVYGGRPSFQDPHGDALPTGWTGYDCSIPICVQAQRFILNVKNTTTVTSTSVTVNPNYMELAGHGGDGAMTCLDPATNLTLPRCPSYDLKVSSNDGHSFQTGCGFDPFDTGCCIDHFDEPTLLKCYICDTGIVQVTPNTFYCQGEPSEYITNKESRDSPFFQKYFIEPTSVSFKKCGQFHSPRWHRPYITPVTYGVAQYYEDLDPRQSSYNFKSNFTSNRFLCGVMEWVQGDFVDDAGLGNLSGMGSIYGLTKGRHSRINYANMIHDPNTGTWSRGKRVEGEGVYACYNQGSCLGPDVCTCSDGYTGYDCSIPICRHLWPDGSVKGCLNGGICTKKDNCSCVQTLSVSYLVHPEAVRGVTGWTGSDCSLPMCVQGYFDPYCTDLSSAPGGEGCFRCANGGNCTAPDVCQCAPGWTGYDCRTPVCTAVADSLTRIQLGTSYEDKVISFESDPCGVVAKYGRRGWHGAKYARGNCTQPNQCTCLCKLPYINKDCVKYGRHCQGPYQDPLFRYRNILQKKGPEFVFGSAACVNGYEGSIDSIDRFRTCHLTIYTPTSVERRSLGLVVGMAIFGAFAALTYYVIGARLRKQYLLAKIERRRSKRSSEDSLLKPKKGF